MARNGIRPAMNSVDSDLVGGVEHRRRGAARYHRLPRQKPEPETGRDRRPRRSVRAALPDRDAAPDHRSAPARPGNARSAPAYRAVPAAPPPSRRGIRPARAPPIADAPARRSRPAAARTDDAPRSVSRPLFISVAESMVIFGPIDQFGWRSACSGVACSIASSDQVRNGPPDAVRMTRRTSSRRPAPIAWNSALCSLSTGSTVAPNCCTARMNKRAGADEAFLVGERDSGAALDRGHGRLQADRAGRSPPSPSRPDARAASIKAASPAAASMPLPASASFSAP